MSSGSEDDDQSRISRAYNNSIYLMLVVPYSCFGLVCFMVYRHLRARDAMMAASLPPTNEGTEPCPTTSPAAPS